MPFTPSSLVFEITPGKHLAREELMLYKEAERQGIPVRYVPVKHLQRRRTDALEKYDLPAGSIRFIHACLKYLRVPESAVNYYPTTLKPWMHRHTGRCDLRDVAYLFLRGERFGERVFIKPADKLKSFTGFVAESEDDIRALQCSKKLRVEYSEVVEFVVEWRVYVIAGSICCVAPYAGDESTPAPLEGIVEMVSAALSQRDDRKTFTLDVGLLSTGELALVEFGEAYSVGAYDISPADYLSFLAHWWQENVLSFIASWDS